MQVDKPSGSHRHKSHKPRRSRRSSGKLTQWRRSPSRSGDERVADQAEGSDQGSIVSKRSRPTWWDMKPLIPIPPIQPRRDVTKELRCGGSHTNEELERQQRNDRDRQMEKERSRWIQAGTAEQPIFLPHLQEPMPLAPLQLQCIMDQTHMETVDVLIQKSARPEPPPVMFQ